MQGVQVKLWYPLTMHAVPERLRDVWCIGAMQIVITLTLTLETELDEMEKIQH